MSFSEKKIVILSRIARSHLVYITIHTLSRMLFRHNTNVYLSYWVVEQNSRGCVMWVSCQFYMKKHTGSVMNSFFFLLLCIRNVYLRLFYRLLLRQHIIILYKNTNAIKIYFLWDFPMVSILGMGVCVAQLTSTYKLSTFRMHARKELFLSI